MKETDNLSEILLMEEPYQIPMRILLSVLASLNLTMTSVALFFLIFQKVPEGITPMLLWLKEEIVDNNKTEKELTYSVLMEKAILIARSIEESLPESYGKLEK